MFTNNILVSIVVPVFNAAQFLDETINSLINQTLTNIQIILVDDGSEDNSYEICEKFLKNDSRIKLLTKKNSGVSIARNKGLNEANGEYIFFMDADDTIDNKFIQTSYEIAKSNNCDILVIGDYFYKRLSNVLALPTWSQFIKLEFLKEHLEIRFPEGIQPCEDGLFSHQLLLMNPKIGYNFESQYYYREHENQNHVLINSNSQKVINQIPLWFNILEDFYSKNNLWDTKAIELAKFIEHEPFEFRYLSMHLNEKLKEQLHHLIVDFMNEKVIKFLKNEDIKRLNPHFRKFLNSPDYLSFDKYLKNYKLVIKIKFKIEAFLINLIPISSIKKKIRKKTVTKFNENFNYPAS